MDHTTSQLGTSPRISSTRLPVQQSAAPYIARLHKLVHNSQSYNYAGLRIPIQSPLKISAWRTRLHDYHDKIVADFLEFGWPVNYQSETLPTTFRKNHPSAVRFSDAVDKYVTKEVTLEATVGPYTRNPLHQPLATSPLSAVPKKNSSDMRIVMDLSFPRSTSVNDGIPSDQFLGAPFKLTYPTIRTLLDLVRDHGQGCLLYKLDLRRAYRQLPVDPHDYHLLGFWWRDSYYVDTRLPFGLRSAPQACQRSTNAIVYMHTRNGHQAVNYLDDFCGVSPSSQALAAFNSMRNLLVELGLEEATEKTVSSYMYGMKTIFHIRIYIKLS